MDVRLPRLGEGADSGTVASIFVKEGDRVKKDQPILELESEKAVASIPSPSAGIITKIYVKEGDEVKVGQPIVSLEGNGAAVKGKERTETSTVSSASAQDEAVEEAGGAPESEQAIEVTPEADGRMSHTAPSASPSVRKLARDLGIDLTRVKGSERGGRIVIADLRRHILQLQQIALRPKAAPGESQATPKAVAESTDFSKWGPVVTKRMSTLRRTISSKMAASWSTIPHIAQFDEADITQVIGLRKTYGPKYEKRGGYLTLTSFALKAVVVTLQKHPMFNASLDEATNEIVFKNYYHIGIAVDTEQGLIVPVLRDVDKKTLLDLSVELQEIAEKARQRKLTLEEMQGGTFTISNQGGIGSGYFTPIINKPEVAILGLGRGVLKPVVRGAKVVQRTMLPVCLSYDHRLIDGADAARFMVDLVKEFESFKEKDVKI